MGRGAALSARARTKPHTSKTSTTTSRPRLLSLLTPRHLRPVPRAASVAPSSSLSTRSADTDASSVTPPSSATGAALSALPSLPSLPSLALPHALPLPLPRALAPAAPLRPSPSGISVGAAVRTGLLHNLRGAPCQHRNAIVVSPRATVVMLAVFAGHGKHGATLAELAATVVSRSVRRHLRADASARTPHTLEGLADAAFVHAALAVADTPFARSSGVEATVLLLKKGTLVVGTCGAASVMLASRRAGATALHTVLPAPPRAPSLDASRPDARAPGLCQLPTIRTFAINARHTHVALATQPLWAGEDREAPSVLADVMATGGECPVQIADRLMDVAFGAAGPTHDASILAARLR